MKFIKKNKFTIIAIIIFIILVVLGVKVKELLVPDEGKTSYGDRLNELEENKRNDDLITNMENKVKENQSVLKFSHKVHGKIINLLITLKDDVSVEDAKSIANNLVLEFQNEELSYYSLQVYLLKESEELNNFPIIGYKDTETENLVFTKDRDIIRNEETNEE